MSVLWFKFVATIRVIISLGSRSGIQTVGKELVEHLVRVVVLGVTVDIPVTIMILAVNVAVLLTLTEPLLEESGDVVDHTAKLLVTVGLCSLEASGNVSPDKRHGDRVRHGCIGGGGGVGLDGWAGDEAFRGRHELGRVRTSDARRVGHGGQRWLGREGRGGRLAPTRGQSERQSRVVVHQEGGEEENN